MFEHINKSKLTFDKYIELKSKTITKSYSEKYKWVDKFMYAFSWFGNVVSIFLAFFFLQTLFYSSFNEVSNSIWITLGIIVFLTMFELLKRYVFSMFSMEFIKVQFKIFKRSMFGFIFSTLLLISGSFYFSLNGAQEFIDNQKTFETKTIQVVKTNVDSVTNYYNTILIQPIQTENIKLTEQNDKYYESSTKMYSGKYLALIEANNKKIENNNNKILSYETQRDAKIEIIKQENDKLLSKTIESNKDNVITFLIISTIIELIIIFGIYYDVFYDYKTLKEYEDTIINTSEFKTWHKYNFLLDLIYNNVKNVGDYIPTSDGLLEMAKDSKSPMSKVELDKFIKILYNLEIISKDGKRRTLNIPMEKGTQLLKDYFGIK